MIKLQHIPELDLLVVTAVDPFTFVDLSQHALAQETADGGLNPDLARPTIFDFRRVSLIRQDTASVHRMFAQRQRIEPRQPNNPAAHIVANEDDYGMMRMYCSLAASYGLREIEKSLVTLDVNEAAVWMLAQTGQPRDAKSSLLQNLELRAAS